MRTPLVRQVAAQLEERILNDVWLAGSRIPAERELASEFGVARSTVREALELLERSGLVIRHQGSGTFVAQNRLQQSLLGHFSIVDALRSTGAAITTVLREQSVEPASPLVARELGVAAGDRVLHVERLRNADGDPFMLESTWLPAEALPGIERVDLRVRSLYDTLREDYGVALVSAVESFEPILLRPDEARLLHDQTDAPALLLLRTTSDDSGRAMETARAVLRADRCRALVQRVVREPARAAARQGEALR
jgi:GntR family transcriptional regulator